jgi:hypothetical protein
MAAAAFSCERRSHPPLTYLPFVRRSLTPLHQSYGSVPFSRFEPRLFLHQLASWLVSFSQTWQALLISLW